MRLNRIVLPLAAGLVLAGCNPIYYSPNTQNVLAPLGRGELTAAGMANNDRGELQVAYAISDAVAVQVNGGFFEQDAQDDGDGGSGRFLELGAGYSAPISDALAWEVHGLAGAGSVENDFPSTVGANPGTTGELTAGLLRFGVQPALGFRARYFEAAVSARVLGLRYRDVEGSLVYEGEGQVQKLRDANGYFLFEPALTLRAGLESVKLQLQTVRSFNLTDRDFRQDRSILTLGVVLDVATAGR